MSFYFDRASRSASFFFRVNLQIPNFSGFTRRIATGAALAAFFFTNGGLLEVCALEAAQKTVESAPGNSPLEPKEEDAYEAMRLLANAIQLIRQEYVHVDAVDYKSLAYSALRGLLSELDPHCQFMEPEDFKAMQEDTRSEFGGIGLQLGVKEGQLTVIAPIEDTPASEAGILPGDRILKIDGKITDRLTLPEAIKLLRGKKGQKVTLTISSMENPVPRDITLVRRMVKVRSVRDARILPLEQTGGLPIGYVRITQFSEPTAEELDKALAKLSAEGMQALVLDLRYNPGGLLESAVDICSRFLPENTPVVSTSGRASGRDYSTSAAPQTYAQLPLAILVNSASASASEIVAGALKDRQRALIVGETTFGKGSVQSVIGLFDGSAVRLTTAEYFTPSKNRIHKHGIAPHIRVVLSPALERELLRGRRAAELEGRLPNPTLDEALTRAADALRAAIRPHISYETARATR